MQTTVQGKSIDTKATITIILVIGIVVVGYVLIKHLTKIVSGAGKGIEDAGAAVGTGLGLENSDDKKYVNKLFQSGNYPLFSNYFDKIAPLPTNSKLFKVSTL